MEFQMMPMLIGSLFAGVLWCTVVQFVAANISRVAIYLVLLELCSRRMKIKIGFNNLLFRDVIAISIIVITLVLAHGYIFVFNKSLLLFACIKMFQFGQWLSIKQLYFPTFVTPEQETVLRQSPLIYRIVSFGSSSNKLSGIYVHGDNFDKTPPILYCHGNAGNVYDRVQFAWKMTQSIGCDIFMFDYRNFGNSSNCKMDQTGIINDSVAAFYELKRMYAMKKERYKVGINKEVKPIIFGNSLGGAVAIHTVHELLTNPRDNVSISGLIIQNSFTSTFETASYLLFRCNWFKWVLFPIMAHKWNSLQCITNLDYDYRWKLIPKLFLSGKKDCVINPLMMQQLVGASRRNSSLLSNTVLMKEFANGDHHNTCQSPMYFKHLNDFVSSCSML